MRRTIFGCLLTATLTFAPSSARAADEEASTAVSWVMAVGGLTMATSSFALRRVLLDDTREQRAVEALPGSGVVLVPLVPLAVLAAVTGRADAKDVVQVSAIALSGLLELGGLALAVMGFHRLLRDPAPRRAALQVAPFAAGSGVGLVGRW